MFEITRLSKILTFENALMFEATDTLRKLEDSQSVEVYELLLELLRTKIGDIVKSEDLVAFHYFLNFIEYEGVIPLKDRQYVLNSHIAFTLLLWDLYNQNDCDLDHPLVPIARRYLADRQKHFDLQKTISESVSRIEDHVFGVVPLTSLGEFGLEQAVRNICTHVQDKVLFILNGSTYPNLHLYGSESPGRKLVAVKTKNAILTMDLSE